MAGAVISFGWQESCLEVFAVGQGPGNVTGIRVLRQQGGRCLLRYLGPGGRLSYRGVASNEDQLEKDDQLFHGVKVRCSRIAWVRLPVCWRSMHLGSRCIEKTIDDQA